VNVRLINSSLRLFAGEIMKLTFSSVLFGLLIYVALLPVADAHTFGAHGAGFAAGLAHPFLGLDHLLAMVAVGIWASQLGGKATWLAPVAFVGVMASSAFLGSLGVELPMLEPAIASSVLILGLLVAFAVRLSMASSLCIVGLFAFFHGLAHGLELPQAASPVLYALGFVSATALLHGIGIGMGLTGRRNALVLRLGGSVIALTGLCLLATA
jgi:urease accessory protein